MIKLPHVKCLLKSVFFLPQETHFEEAGNEMKKKRKKKKKVAKVRVCFIVQEGFRSSRLEVFLEKGV